MSVSGKNDDESEEARLTAEAVVRRRTIVIVVAVLAAIVIAGATFAAFGFNGADRRTPGPTTAASGPASTASSTPTPSATPSTPPRTEPSPPAAIDPRFGAPVAQTVPKDATADLGNTVSARITKITSTTATGTQAGEVSGPAARVELTITNGTTGDISLDGVSVNAYYGSGMTPASPIAAQDSTAFGGTLAASKTAAGTYLFSVPKDQQAGLVITVSRAAGTPIVVFQG
jgi:cytoskeletal protein RodZ